MCSNLLFANTYLTTIVLHLCLKKWCIWTFNISKAAVSLLRMTVSLHTYYTTMSNISYNLYLH